MTSRIFQNAPRFLLGAFFLFAHCHGQENDPKSQGETTPASEPKTEAPDSPKGAEAKTEAPAADLPETGTDGIRFMSYNVQNYLTMDRYVKGGERKSSSKDPSEIAALVEIIVAEEPDILGICEIGTPEDLKDLRSRLRKAGLDLPHTLHTGGYDETRHLALLSALPIKSNNSREEVIYRINGRERMMGRGILDVTIDLPGGPTHFIGLHLKSKRELREFDQAEIRLNEARLAREHCEALLAKDPDARLVVYGDFNDTRKTPPLAMLMGNYKSDTYLGDVFVKDSRDHLWTHFWSWQQQYARFDWVLVSPSVMPEVEMKKSYVVDPAIWNEASDHRAILVTLRN